MGLFRRRPKFNVSYWDVPDRDNCEFNIVGESYYEPQLRALLSGGKHKLKSLGDWKKLGVQFWLVREPHNEYDKNAIAVCASQRENYDHTTALQVGYLDRNTAAIYASDIVHPVPVKGTIVGKEGRFGVKLDKADMDAGGLSSEVLNVHIREDVVQSLVRRGREREDEWEITKSYEALLRHSPGVTDDDPNAIEIVIVKGDEVAGTVAPTAKLWGPNVDGLKVKLTLYRWCYERFGDEYDEEDELWAEVLARLPSNAREASDWECSPYCAKIDKTPEGKFQAVGRLQHTRFKIPTCEASKQAFREAKKLNAALLSD